MIRTTTGNLLECDADALVNTVNTVGVMGKGIALMFKEKFPQNFHEYKQACQNNKVQLGQMFTTQNHELFGPKWIVNFPTKNHWRNPSQLQWIQDGLQSLRHFIQERNVTSIAIPPLGAGNGKLPWPQVRVAIFNALDDLKDVDIILYEPIELYQNTPKPAGVEELTIPRALMAALIREYEVLGFECSHLEVQKLAWFLNKNIEKLDLRNNLNLEFEANRYGPYSENLRHLLIRLDGSYLHSAKRLQDADPFEPLWTDKARLPRIATFLKQPSNEPYIDALNATAQQIDGFQSPLGLELLGTVDWLLTNTDTPATVFGIRNGIDNWPADAKAITRKQDLFSDHMLEVALAHLEQKSPSTYKPESGQLTLVL